MDKILLLKLFFLLRMSLGEQFFPTQRISETDRIENGLKPPSQFQTLLARLSAGTDDTILTSLTTSGRSIGTIGGTLRSAESSVSSFSPSSSSSQSSFSPSSSASQSSFSPSSSASQSSFSPRILSTGSAPTFASFEASDNSFVSRALINGVESKEGPTSSPSQATVLFPANQVENQLDSSHDESLPISAVIPVIISAMHDQKTSEEEKVSLQSLLSDMVRSARQQQVEPVLPAVSGGVDFSKAQRTADGRLCVIKEETIETLAKEPVLECVHNNIEKCHYTYITQFEPTQEEECSENFQKNCQITFRKEAVRDTVRKCYRPQRKVCNGSGPEQCQTVKESDCTTKYVEKSGGKFVGETSCTKVPVEICGRGCVYQEGEEECHEKQIDSLVDVPEEICDLNPQKTCHLVTKLVPNLSPKQECTTVPKETCNLKFVNPEVQKKPLRTEWCLEEENELSSSIQAFGRADGANIQFPASTLGPLTVPARDRKQARKELRL